MHYFIFDLSIIIVQIQYFKGSNNKNNCRRIFKKFIQNKHNHYQKNNIIIEDISRKIVSDFNYLKYNFQFMIG